MTALGTGKRSADHRAANKPDDGALPWSDIVLARSDRSPMSFTGALLQAHQRPYQNGLLLAVTLWRRRLTGFVIGYPVCVMAGRVDSDAVKVDSVAEAILYLEDLCAIPPSIDPRPLSLDALVQAHQISRFNQVFSALVGDVLADWTAFDAISGTSRIPQQAPS
jgi:hypothetical protein